MRPSLTRRSSTSPSTIERFARFAKQRLDRLAIELAVGLGPGPAYRRTLAAIEHPELNTGPVRRDAHQAVQGVDFPDQVALADPADGGIARHGADRRKGVGDERRPRAEARRGGRCLGAGVAAANDNDIEPVHGDFPSPLAPPPSKAE